MLTKYLFSVLALLGYTSLGLAEYAITIPWVGYTISGNYFDEWQGELVAENGESTTYHVEPHCPPKSHCPTLDPPVTFIVAPNTYELITTNHGGFIGYSSSACTFTGSPSPTKAHCSYTDSYEFRSSAATKSDTINVPDSLYPFTIYPVTLTAAGSGSASATGTTTGTATATATATVTQATGASTASAISQGAASNTQATSTTPSTTRSGNIAVKTTAPMVVMGGILAGAMFLN